MIRFTYTYIEPIALLISNIVLFQCRMIIDKKPVKIDEAINVKNKYVRRIKIDLLDGEKLILDSVYCKNNELYGLLTRPKEKTKILLEDDIYPDGYYVYQKVNVEVKIEENEILRIRLHYRKKSMVINIFVAISILAAVYISLFLDALT